MLPVVILAIEDESDRAFMTQIYLDHERIMYAEMLKMSDNRGIMDDVFQESLIRLIDKIDVLRSLDERKRVNYIITTVRNQMRNYRRDHKKDPAISLDDEENSIQKSLCSEDSLDEIVYRSQRTKKLHNIWPRLSEQTQQLLESKYILGLSNAEIAKDFGVKTESVRMMLTRARKEALSYLQDDE